MSEVSIHSIWKAESLSVPVSKEEESNDLSLARFRVGPLRGRTASRLGRNFAESICMYVLQKGFEPYRHFTEWV